MNQRLVIGAIGLACAAAAPAGDAPDWGGGLHVPITDGQSFACPSVALPAVAVLGEDVWDLRTGRARDVKLDGAPSRPELAAVSADGSAYAAMPPDGRNSGWSVTAWACGTGRPTATLAAGSKDREPRAMAFSGPTAKDTGKWLVVIGHNDKPKRSQDGWADRADVWELATGKVHHSFVVAEPVHRSVAVSPDGRYLAVVGRDHVHVYDVRAGREAGTMRDPPTDPAAPKPTAARPAGHAAGLRSVAAGGGPRFADYGWAQGVAFSPSGREVAALFDGSFSGKPNRLIIWDTSGHVTFDSGHKAMPGNFDGGEEGQRRTVQWSPDGTRLLLAGGWLVDRKTGTALWHLADPSANGEGRRPVFLDNARLLAQRGEALDACDIPVADITASLAALANPKVPAGLRPGQQVSLSVDLVGTLRGDAGQTKADLTQGMTAALVAAGLTVAGGQPAAFHVSFSEEPGETLEVYESRGPFPMPFRGHDTGRKATGAKGKATVELRVAGTADPVWSQTVNGFSPIGMTGPVDDGTLRAAMEKGLCSELARVVVPTFVPADPSLKPLPIEAE